uniref:Uncharacterized protein n=1 Tax=Leersia perrieri TaxID=77586 RepID=A0A0D9V0F7_9ORYZ
MGESGVLKSIVYQRGSLRLLDQRKLSLEVAYIDVKCSTDGCLSPNILPSTVAPPWVLLCDVVGLTGAIQNVLLFLLRLKLHGLFRNAIRDMVVRGAPAVAISAALALAVEVSGLDFIGTPAEAATFISEKLEYIVSRYEELNLLSIVREQIRLNNYSCFIVCHPTALNLSDAARKLQSLVSRTTESEKDAKRQGRLCWTAGGERRCGRTGGKRHGGRAGAERRCGPCRRRRCGRAGGKRCGDCAGGAAARRTRGWRAALRAMQEASGATVVWEPSSAAATQGDVFDSTKLRDNTAWRLRPSGDAGV